MSGSLRPLMLEDPWRGARALHPAASRPARLPAGLALFSRIDVEGCFAFLLFAIMLFSIQLGTVGAAMLAVLIPGYAVLQRKRLWEILAPRAFLLLIPTLALASVVWSEAPRDSLKFALELALTVLAALLLAGAQRRRAVLRGMSAAFAIYVLIAISFGHVTAVGNDGGQAFSGLSDGKNLLADIAASGLLISLGVLATSLRRDRLAWALVGAGGALVELYAVLVARSAGAMMGLAFGVIALGGLLLVHRSRVALRGVLVGFLGVCMVIAAATYQWLANLLLQLGADLFDKDATLTGRTYLWYRADELIHEKPMLGRGFYAFWLQGNTDAEGLWRYAGITSRGGFTFHNTLVEILVQLGWTGVIVIGLTALVAVIILVFRCVRRPTLSLCVWTSLLFYELVRTPIEAVGIAPFYFSTVLTFAALAVALSPADQPRRAAARRGRSAYVNRGAAYNSRRLLTTVQREP